MFIYFQHRIDTAADHSSIYFEVPTEHSIITFHLKFYYFVTLHVIILLLLGKRGLYNTSGGLKIAYLGGLQTNKDKTQVYEFNKADVIALRDMCLRGQPNFRGVDVLLTSQWPKNVYNLDSNHKVIIIYIISLRICIILTLNCYMASARNVTVEFDSRLVGQ